MSATIFYILGFLIVAIILLFTNYSENKGYKEENQKHQKILEERRKAVKEKAALL